MKILNEVYNESQTKIKSRLKILNTAFSYFSVNGFDDFSLTDIAEMSDITPRNLYRYYSSKEALITDVAFHSISQFNNTFPIIVDQTLSGYEQLKDLLQKQIEHKIISANSNNVITFIGYFDVYMTKANLEHESIINYIKVYSPILKENLLNSIKKALINGVTDKTLILQASEIEYYIGYIYHSLMSLMARVAVKHYELDVSKYDFIQMHINIILQHLKK